MIHSQCVGAGAELPSAVEEVAAVDRLGHALRGVGGGHPGVDVVAPDLFRHPRIGIRELVGVHADDPVDPACRGVQRRGGHDRFRELARVYLEPVVLLGLQQPDRTDGLQVLDRLVGQPTEPLGFGGLLAQSVGDRHHPVENPFGHDVSLSVGARR